MRFIALLRWSEFLRSTMHSLINLGNWLFLESIDENGIVLSWLSNPQYRNNTWFSISIRNKRNLSVTYHRFLSEIYMKNIVIINWYIKVLKKYKRVLMNRSWCGYNAIIRLRIYYILKIALQFFLIHGILNNELNFSNIRYIYFDA